VLVWPGLVSEGPDDDRGGTDRAQGRHHPVPAAVCGQVNGRAERGTNRNYTDTAPIGEAAKREVGEWRAASSS